MSQLTLLFAPEETSTHCSTTPEQNPTECTKSTLLCVSHEILLASLAHPTNDAPPPTILPDPDLPHLLHHAAKIIAPFANNTHSFINTGAALIV